MQRAGELARRLKVASGDALLAEAVSVAERAVTAGSADVIAAHRDFGHALALFEDGAYARASAAFAAATATLQRAGSPLHLWGTFYLATCRHMAQDYQGAAADLEALLAAIGDAPYPVLEAASRRKRWRS